MGDRNDARRKTLDLVKMPRTRKSAIQIFTLWIADFLVRGILISILFLQAAHSQTESHWIIPEGKPAQGVIVALHGLNSSVDTLDEIAKSLTQYNYAVNVVTLAGNEPSEEKLHSASKDRWIQNLSDGVTEAKKRYPSLPLFNLSYSAGAATSAVASHEKFSDAFQGYVFLAPALELRTYTELIHPLIWISQPNALLPTLAPEGYRAHKWVSLNSYRALLDMVNESQRVGFSEKMKNVPGLIALDPGDEFIPYPSLRNYFEKQNASQWRFLRVDAEGDFMLPFHLITTRKKVGQETFNNMINEIVRVFTMSKSMPMS